MSVVLYNHTCLFAQNDHYFECEHFFPSLSYLPVVLFILELWPIYWKDILLPNDTLESEIRISAV